MVHFIDWIGNLSTGVLASIIATFICSLFIAGVVVSKVKRKSKLFINQSDIGGDIVVGDKRSNMGPGQPSINDNRTTDTILKKTKVKGDVVQGDKEG